jgi:hypothetical protein
MGTGSLDFVPMQLTKAFREAQTDEKFQSWLKMQDAVMGIEFPIYDVPEIRDQMYTKGSLAIVENKLLELYPNHRVAFDSDHVHTTMRFVYYIGETFRRAFEGMWVALPRLSKPTEPPVKAAVDFPMREAYIEPAGLVKIAVNRRNTDEITRVYGYAERDYAKWINAGRPERTYLGRLREDD